MSNWDLGRLLYWLFISSRGGPTRLRIILALKNKPFNTHQLSQNLSLDFSTIKHHIQKLETNGIIVRIGDGYGATYFLSDFVSSNYDQVEKLMNEEELEKVNRDLSDSG